MHLSWLWTCVVGRSDSKYDLKFRLLDFILFGYVFHFVFGSWVDLVIWLSYLRSVSIKCGRRIVKHDVRYYDIRSRATWARLEDCFNNFDVITSQQSAFRDLALSFVLLGTWLCVLSLETHSSGHFFFFIFYFCFVYFSQTFLICSFKWITIFYL